MKNILTVDLEDWFSVETFQQVIDRKQWISLESTVEPAVDRILAMFSERKIRATFFVLGWIAEHYPALIARVAGEGHEIACHSYYHRQVSSLTPEEFRADTGMAIKAIYDACGIRPNGYRSPSWGMRRDMAWAYEILDEFGFVYDSSIFPIHHDIYGDPGAPRRPYEVAVLSGRTIVEIPASTVIYFGKRIPIAGGGWLRQFPYWFTRKALKKINTQENQPFIFYFHPWELDPGQPKMKNISHLTKFRHYNNLAKTTNRLEKLLTNFNFTPISSK